MSGENSVSIARWAKLHGVPITRARKLAANGEIPSSLVGGITFVDQDVSPPVSDDISCMVCGKAFQQIASRHVATHGMTLQGYREQFPESPLISESASKKIANRALGRTHSKETRDQISRNRKWKSGKRSPLSQETRDKISAAHMGKVLSDDHKAAIAEGLKGGSRPGEKISKSLKALDQTEIARKRKETMLDRYGVDNAMKVHELKEKAFATAQERFGGAPSAHPDIQEKVRRTNEERYGGHPSAREAAREASRARGMKEARQAFKEQYGVGNPFELEVFQDRAKASMLARYGVENALQSSEIRDRMRARYMANDRFWVNQDHIPEAAYAVLMDAEVLASMIVDTSISSLAASLNIQPNLVYKYCARHGLHLPKSSYETEIAAYLKSRSLSFIANDRKTLGGLEVDFLVGNIAIEFCGLYWHSEFGPNARGRNYHLAKLEAAERAGIRLITIFEDEWVHRNQTCRSRLDAIFGKSQRGDGARKLKISGIEASLARDFLDRHHLQGKGSESPWRYGAFDGDDLVAVMTFGNPRVSLGRHNGYPELVRFATDGKNYPGIASKLLKAFLREHDPEGVISYADRRWSDGGLYSTLGFTMDGYSKPSYAYFKGSDVRRLYRYSYRKDRIAHLVEDGSNMTEIEIMRTLGYNRIWDCGTMRFVLTK